MSWTRPPGATLPELSLGRSRHVPTPLARGLVALLAVASVGLEIAAIAAGSGRRDQLVAATALAFTATCLLHAALRRGLLWALGLLVLAGGVGFAAEATSLAIGYPFGDHVYADRLGARVLDVPLVVVAGCVALSYPALVVARRLVGGWVGQVLVGTLAFAGVQLLLDAVLVEAGYVQWAGATRQLTGVPDVPLTRDLGWLVVALLLMALLSLLPRRRADDRVPQLLWLWLWLSSTVAVLALADHRAAALWGGGALALVGIPLLLAMTAAPRP